MPVTSLKASKDVGDDTFLELCAPLIQSSYELVKVSHSWRDSDIDEEVLAGVERDVNAWQPTISFNWSEQVSAKHAVHVLSQVRVHKTMMLLFARRLCYPVGVEDATASHMARSIFFEFDLATIATDRAPMWIMTPSIVAAFSLVDPNERLQVLRHVAEYGDKLSPMSQQLAFAFFQALWTY